MLQPLLNAVRKDVLLFQHRYDLVKASGKRGLDLLPTIDDGKGCSLWPS